MFEALCQFMLTSATLFVPVICPTVYIHLAHSTGSGDQSRKRKNLFTSFWHKVGASGEGYP